MNKAHLTEALLEKTKALSRREAEKVVNCMFDSIRDALLKPLSVIPAHAGIQGVGRGPGAGNCSKERT